MVHWPFEVVEKDGSPLIKVQYLGEEKIFSSQEISSMVLSKMKEISEAKLGKTVKKAVVTFVSLTLAWKSDSDLPPVFLPTLTIHNVLLPKMLEPLQVLTFSVSSMSLQLPLSLTDLIANPKQKRMC